MRILPKSDFPPSAPDTYVHLALLGYVVSLPVPRMPRPTIRPYREHLEIVRAL